MTENEATREMTFQEEYEILQKEKEELFAMEICNSETPFANCVVRRSSRCIGKLLEEIQQYRAIGTVEQLKTMFDGYWKLKDLCEEYEKYGLPEDYWKLNEMCKEYSAIGTVEECRTAYAKGYNQGTIDRAEEVTKAREHGYAKAVQEFSEALCNRAEEESIDVYFHDGLYGLVVEIENLKDMVGKIAEQMKGGGNNEN